MIVLLCVAQLASAEVVRKVGVRSLGSVQTDQSFVLAHTEVRVGEELDQAQISRDVRRLLDTQRFSYVGVDVEPSGESGIQLFYVVKRRPLLSRNIEVEGNDHFSDSKIRKWIDLEGGEFFDEQQLEAAGRKIRREYRDARFPSTKVTWDVREVDATNLLAEPGVDKSMTTQAKPKGAMQILR